MPDIEIPDWTKLGSTVRSERKRAGLTQQALAERASLSRSWLARLEAGHRTAELESIMRLLRALDLTLVLRRASADDEPPTPAGPNDPAYAAALESLLTRRSRDMDARSRAWTATERRDDDG
ncbi:helix-turn-helix domain-containing protein [Nocardioides sp. BYT-33-1]|uniref:helix-turn-helix domain-containing protein n=1 Tax=Nocardioides sp. BYT-33-1 TaxID=3416952 RepID=UPI003F53C0F5